MSLTCKTCKHFVHQYDRRGYCTNSKVVGDVHLDIEGHIIQEGTEIEGLSFHEDHGCICYEKRIKDV